MTKRKNALADLQDQWSKLSSLEAKVKNGTASAAEKQQYQKQAAAFQSSYNDYYSQGLISSTDFNNTNFGSTASSAYDVATNNEKNLGDAYISDKEQKQFYYAANAWNDKKYLFKLPSTSVLYPEDDWLKAMEKGKIQRLLDTSGQNRPLGEISVEAKSWGGDVTKIPDGLYMNLKGTDKAFAVHNKQFYEIGKKGSDNVYKLPDDKGSLEGIYTNRDLENLYPGWLDEIDWNQEGTLDLLPGLTGLNEIGTEAIVTPSGTITALPTHTGIVPADITKNLWELGEVAPEIMRVMRLHLIPDSLGSNSFGNTTDESFNIDNLTMNVSADDSFDADAFVDSIKARVALTKNIKHY